MLPVVMLIYILSNLQENARHFSLVAMSKITSTVSTPGFTLQSKMHCDTF